MWVTFSLRMIKQQVDDGGHEPWRFVSSGMVISNRLRQPSTGRDSVVSCTQGPFQNCASRNVMQGGEANDG